MRKISLALAALILLSSCGSSGSWHSDPKGTAATLLEGGGFSQQLEALDADLVDSYYGFSASPDEAYVYTSLEGGYEELAVLVFNDSDLLDEAVSILADRIIDLERTEVSVQYKPEDLPKIRDAVLKKRESVLVFAVASDADIIKDVLK